MTLDGPPLTTWFFQEKNPLIVKVGEVKLTIANKKRILNRVLCHPQPVSPDSPRPDEVTEEIRWAHPLSVLQSQ